MGYRSQVRAVVYGSKEKLDAYILAQELIFANTILKEFSGNLTRYQAKAWYPEEKEPRTVEVLDLYGDGWKWYESYEDVQAWTKFMTECSDFGLDYEFVRVGEDREDVEVEGTNDSHNFFWVGTPPIVEDIDKVGENLPLTLLG